MASFRSLKALIESLWAFNMTSCVEQTNITKMYQIKKRIKIQKMPKKYSKLAANSISTLVYSIFMKKNIYFFFFLKPRYNWYKVKKIVVPTLNCSNLYQTPLVQWGTIGTIVQKVSNTNDLRGARTWITYLNLNFIKAGVYKGYDQEEEIKI